MRHCDRGLASNCVTYKGIWYKYRMYKHCEVYKEKLGPGSTVYTYLFTHCYKTVCIIKKCFYHIGNIVVHFMLQAKRDILELEKLWSLGHEYDDQYKLLELQGEDSVL